MGSRDARVDAYISRSAAFAQPILLHLRDVIHAACPDVEETMKWSFPHFMYKGMMCSFASFKQHCAFGFWKGALVLGEDARGEEAMGHFGRITSLKDLPSRKTITGYIRRAMELNEQGIAAPRTRRAPNAKPVDIPPALAAAFRANKRAAANFKALRPSHQREYAEWISEAKREETRARRVGQALELLEQGKPRYGNPSKS